MEKIFVTGANGHVGCNTVRELILSGYQVKALVRKNSNIRGLQGLEMEICYGDVQDLTSLEQGSKGCDIIFHHAAVYRFFEKDIQKIIAPAVEGTTNIFKAADKNQIKKIIYTSSMLAAGISKNKGQLRTGADWAPENTREVYMKGKRMSEQLAWRLAKQYGIEMTSILPGPILGRYDYAITPSNAFVADTLQGKGAMFNMNLPFVDVRDVAKIHVRALQKGKPGTRYFALSETIDIRELANIVYKKSGMKTLYIPTPRVMNIILGTMVEKIGRLTDFKPPFTRGVAESFSHQFACYDYLPTVRDLEFQPTPLTDTVHDTINWFLFLKKGRVKNQYIPDFVPEKEWVR